MLCVSGLRCIEHGVAADPGNEGSIPEEDYPRRGGLVLFMNSAHCWLMCRQLRRKRKIKRTELLSMILSSAKKTHLFSSGSGCTDLLNVLLR